ncbi:MAG: hypothetical protein AAFT19_04390 [Pseudomonadota bacterium]
MIIVDLVLALAAIAGFALFLWVIVSTVPEVSLMAVVGIGLFMALFDFLRDIARARRRNAGSEEEG